MRPNSTTMNTSMVFLSRVALVLALNLSISLAFVSNKLSSPITQLSAADGEADFSTPNMGDVGFVLLAGGTGSRMKASMRKFFM